MCTSLPSLPGGVPRVDRTHLGCPLVCSRLCGLLCLPFGRQEQCYCTHSCASSAASVCVLLWDGGAAAWSILVGVQGHLVVVVCASLMTHGVGSLLTCVAAGSVTVWFLGSD